MRERDIRLAIRDALVSTNAFDVDGVWITGLPENYGQGADSLSAAAIEPIRGKVRTGWDDRPAGMRAFSGSCRVTLLARNSDAQLRDEQAEQLLEFLKNSVDGVVLVPGYTVPGKTEVSDWTWADAAAPERRIVAIVAYEYLEIGYQSGDTSA